MLKKNTRGGWVLLLLALLALLMVGAAYARAADTRTPTDDCEVTLIIWGELFTKSVTYPPGHYACCTPQCPPDGLGCTITAPVRDILMMEYGEPPFLLSDMARVRARQKAIMTEGHESFLDWEDYGTQWHPSKLWVQAYPLPPCLPSVKLTKEQQARVDRLRSAR